MPGTPASRRSPPPTPSNSSSSSSNSSSSSSHSSDSLTSIFESSLTLLGSLPVAATSSSSHRPIIHTCMRSYDSSTSPAKNDPKGKGKELKLFLPDVDTFQHIRLQSHLLWPASLLLSQLIESHNISMKDELVLELGAGAGLPSLVSTLNGAKQVTITDYPAPGILKALRRNVQENMDEEMRERVGVVGLDWAEEEEGSESSLEGLSTATPSGYTRILAADTLWISSLHAAQVNVMTTLLSRSSSARIYVIAGLHTGRHCIRDFIDLCLKAGLVMISMKEWDRLESKWSEERRDDAEEEEEGTEESRRRWLVYIELGWKPAA